MPPRGWPSCSARRCSATNRCSARFSLTRGPAPDAKNSGSVFNGVAAMNDFPQRDLLRMWLQTDGALGASEVPLRITNLKAQSSNPPAQRQATSGVSGAARTPAAAAPAAGDLIPGVMSAPPTPGGLLSDLPPLTNEQKSARLAELSNQANAELGKYLSDVATKVVFGEGDPAAALMFVGEGPGAEEDRLGRPFVGRSGQLLDKMILAMGLKRQQVYIANVVKLRAAEPDPETGRLKDRPPTTSEAALGLPWLHRQIEIIRPRVIVTLGASAMKH